MKCLKSLCLAILMIATVSCSTYQVSSLEATATDRNNESLLRDASRAVVQVLHGIGSGSGYFVSKNLVITNCHVVDRTGPDGSTLPTAIVLYPHTAREKLIEGVVESCNPFHDIAAVRILGYESPYTIEFYNIADDLPVMQLDKVWASGYPLGVSLFITEGTYQFSHALSYNSYTCHFTTVPTYPGNSGGALFWISPLTHKVKLLGMPTAGNSRAEHMGCSVTSRDIREFLKQGMPEHPFRKGVKNRPAYINHDMGEDDLD